LQQLAPFGLTEPGEGKDRVSPPTPGDLRQRQGHPKLDSGQAGGAQGYITYALLIMLI
jgi:hypothetical protein